MWAVWWFMRCLLHRKTSIENDDWREQRLFHRESDRTSVIPAKSVECTRVVPFIDKCFRDARLTIRKNVWIANLRLRCALASNCSTISFHVGYAKRGTLNYYAHGEFQSELKSVGRVWLLCFDNNSPARHLNLAFALFSTSRFERLERRFFAIICTITHDRPRIYERRILTLRELCNW